MNVAAAKPNRPRIEGAAIGCRKTRVDARQSATSLLVVAGAAAGRPEAVVS
jgi:hypothetical protein